MLEQADLDSVLYAFKKLEEARSIDSAVKYAIIKGLLISSLEQGQLIYVIQNKSTEYSAIPFQGFVSYPNPKSSFSNIMPVLGKHDMQTMPKMIQFIFNEASSDEKIYFSKIAAERHLAAAKHRKLKQLQTEAAQLQEQLDYDEAQNN